MRQTFEIPLDIPDVTIESVTTNRVGHIEITVKSTVEGTPCHLCGKMTTQFYGEDREITLRHLPILGRKTFIRLRPKRYQCLHCHGNPTTTQTLSWYTPRSSFTQAYEKQILLSLVNSTVQDTSIKEDIGYEAIMGIIDRYIEREINWEDVTRLDVILKCCSNFGIVPIIDYKTMSCRVGMPIKPEITGLHKEALIL